MVDLYYQDPARRKFIQPEVDELFNKLENAREIFASASLEKSLLDAFAHQEYTHRQRHERFWQCFDEGARLHRRYRGIDEVRGHIQIRCTPHPPFILLAIHRTYIAIYPPSGFHRLLPRQRRQRQGA